MTGMVPAAEVGEMFWIDPALEDPDGPARETGGLLLTRPMPMLRWPGGLPLAEAARLEIRTAKLLGVDGFNFYYPLGPDAAFLDRYDQIVAAFLDAAAEDGDFKLTLCLSPIGRPNLTAADIAEIYGTRLKRLLVGSQRDVWLRTPDGRLLLYTWLPDAIVASELGGEHWRIRERPELMATVAAAFGRVATLAGEADAAVLYHLDQIELLEPALDYFPAVYGWVAVGDELDAWRDVAARCAERGRTYVQEVHPDYFTGKLYARDNGRLLMNLDDVLALGVDGVERHGQVLGVSQTFRAKLELAIELGSPLINLTTWNDYPEGHHLAPETTHNFAFAVLMKHYLQRWRGGGDVPADDAIVVFFKRYPAPAPTHFDIAVHNKKAIGPPGVDNIIEVITILAQPGVLHVDGEKPIAVPAGLTITSLPSRPGVVRATVERDGDTVVTVETPVAITFEPRRTDRLTYGFSSEFRRLYEALYE